MNISYSQHLRLIKSVACISILCNLQVLSANAAPNKGRRQPLVAPPNKGSSPLKPPNRSYGNPVSKPRVDGYTTKPTAPWRPARKTHATKRQWYRRYQSPR